MSIRNIRGIPVKSGFGLNADRYFRAINKYPILPQKEQALLAKRAKMGDLMAKDKLIKSNLRYVVSVAMHYNGRGVPLLDLIQEGYEGFKSAIEKFNEKKNASFLSYADFWIRQKISSAVAENNRTIDIPINRCLLGSLVQNVKTRLFQENGEEPTPAEIAERINENFLKKLKTKPTSQYFARLAEISTEEVQRILVETQFPLSIESSEKEAKDEKRTLADCLEDHTVPPPDEEAFSEILRKGIGNQLSFLTKKEKNAVRFYYGVDGLTQTTYEKIGKIFHITSERVRQIIVKANKKLFYNRVLREYAD